MFITAITVRASVSWSERWPVSSASPAGAPRMRGSLAVKAWISSRSARSAPTMTSTARTGTTRSEPIFTCPRYQGSSQRGRFKSVA